MLTTCKTSWLVVLWSVAVLAADASAGKEPETYALLKGNIQASAIGATRVYIIQSNILFKSEIGDKNYQLVTPFPLRKADEQIRSFRVALRNPFALYLLTDKYLYISKDAGVSWTARLLVREKREYNDLSIYPDDENKLLLGTSDGAWLSLDSGTTFQRFFLRVQPEENDVTAVAYDERKDCVYIATRGGMFISADEGKTFYKVMDLPGPYVSHVAVSPVQRGAALFIAGGRAFYSDSRMKRYVLLSSIYDFSECLQVSIADNGSDIVWSYPGGVLWGKDWISDMPQLKQSTQQTPVVQLATNRVQETAEVSITAAEQARILELERRKVLEAKYKRVMAEIQTEPSAREVVNAALEYSKLHPAMIEQWLKDLKKSSWMPEVRVMGNADFGDGEEYGTEGMGTLGIPVRYRTNRNKNDALYGTEAELKWDLGKLFFNPLQIDIDERRSKQTDLREDVANTVTIYYFQRRTMLFRKLFDPPEDFTELSRLEFQIEELTTKLDTLSGGYYSRSLSARPGQNGESAAAPAENVETAPVGNQP